MDLFGGWGGFLGYRSDPAPDTMTIGQLRKRGQRFPDTPTTYYNDFLINASGDPRPPLLDRKQDNDKPLNGTVALIGGGIANLIASYELSRCGVRVTVYEQKGVDPATQQKPLGGRLATSVVDGYVAELGAPAFPSSSPVLWHYVWRWAVSRGRTPDQADQLTVRRFPSPGTVPTKCCYLNEWFEPTSDLSTLPPVVRNAAYRFRSWLHELNDGAPDPTTVYLRDAIADATAPITNGGLGRFWAAMDRRYGGRSFGSVLRTEVFGEGADGIAMYEAFAAVGVGTGGFGPVYDVSVLEVLRQVLWDFRSLYMLPEAVREEQSGEVGGALMQDFAQGLADLALSASQAFFPDRPADEMFECCAPVESVGILGAGAQSKTIVKVKNKEPVAFDYTIIAISSRAMQALGLGQDDPKKNPYSTWGIHTANSANAVASVQAAVKRLNMISSYKAFARIPQPENVPQWPTNAAGQPIKCVVMDRYPRTTIVMPPLPGQADTMLVATEAWSGDALKFQDGFDLAARLGRVATAFASPTNDAPWPLQVIADRLLESTDRRGRDWTRAVGFNGGVRLNRPNDGYFASSLLAQSQLALELESEKQPWGRTFLAGDSVGYLGGWAEGAAMSALTATAAVLFQIRKSITDGNPGELNAQQLLNPRTMPFHRWEYVGAPMPGPGWLKSITAVRSPVEYSEQVPPRWRWEVPVTTENEDLEDVAVAQNGRWMVASLEKAAVSRHIDPANGRWTQWDLVTGPNFDRLAISASRPVPGASAGRPQLVGILNKERWLMHRVGLDYHSEWGTVPVGAQVGADAAIAVLEEPDPARAHIVVLRQGDGIVLHSTRQADGSWASFLPVRSASGLTRRASRVAVAVGPVNHYLVLVCIDNDGVVNVIGRDANPAIGWTEWMQAPNGDLKALRISVASFPEIPGRVQIVALFSDGNVYYRLFEVVGTRYKYQWRPMPYPATSAFSANSVGIGASTHGCDYEGSATVWISSIRKDIAPDQEVEHQ